MNIIIESEKINSSLPWSTENSFMEAWDADNGKDVSLKPQLAGRVLDFCRTYREDAQPSIVSAAAWLFLKDEIGKELEGKNED